MAESEQTRREIDQFVLAEIDSVPHLEALLLLWNSRPLTWPLEALAGRLYVTPEVARELLQDLVRRGLASVYGGPENYGYNAISEERNTLIARLDAAYRREVVRISNLIHSKPSSSVRDFARAFRFTQDKE